MDSYIAGRRWPAQCTKLHVYFLPNPVEIKPLFDTYEPVLKQFDSISLVPFQWLHATVKKVNTPTAQEISAEQVLVLESHLREQLGKEEPFTMVAGGAMATRTSVVLDLTPDREFADLMQITKKVFADIFGAEAVNYASERQHITLGYGTSPGDSGVISGKLLRATGQRATLTVSEVYLVDVIQDAELNQYRWKELARIPLGGGAAA